MCAPPKARVRRAGFPLTKTYVEFGNVVAGEPSGREQNIRRPRKTDVLVNQTLLRGGRGQPDEQIFRQIHSNLIGSIQVVRSTIPHLRQQGGKAESSSSPLCGQAAFPGGSVCIAWVPGQDRKRVVRDSVPSHIPVPSHIRPRNRVRTKTRGAHRRESPRNCLSRRRGFDRGARCRQSRTRCAS